MCKMERKQPRKMHTLEQTEEDDKNMFLGTVDVQRENEKSIQAVTTETREEKEKWSELLKIRDKKVKFKLDTGAECNVLSLKTYNSLGITEKLSKSTCKLLTYSGHQMSPVGQNQLTCEYKGQKHIIQFQIVERDAPAILGRSTCQSLGLIQRIHEVSVENDDIMKNYEDLFSGLGCMPGYHHIQIDSSVKPVVHAPRKVPVALKERIIKELHKMEEMNVIARQTDPTDWVSSMVTIVKPDKIRICLDPQDLNKAIKREHYPLLTVEEVVSNMPNAKVFSVLDANQGFWQIKLDDDSSKLCTFNTPIGRYRFLRLPFGISSASEVFQRAVAQMIEDLDGVINIVDDLLVWGETVQEHDARLRKLLQRAREYNLKLNKKKCQIRTSQIKYIGHVLTADGLKPDEEKVRAVVQLPTPEDKQDLQRFLGMLQYLAKFIPNLSEVSAPLRQLLENDVEWFWGSEQEKSFQKLKALATNGPTLKYYDVNKPLTLSVDASSEGMGAVLLQDQRPVAYGSRALTDCQRRYAQIEKELLAIVYGCEKFHQYVYGREVQVESDHKPLECIFKKPLHQTPLRLQRMLLRLQRYNLKVKYKPGKEMHIADALSRAYLDECDEELLEEELEVNVITTQLPVTEKKLQEFRKETAEDPEMQKLKEYSIKGWPTVKKTVHKDVQKYWTHKEEISYTSGLVFKASKLVIPNKMRKQMLDKIHESHLGMVKSKERARDIIYWPGMSDEIEKMVSQCATCNTHRNSHTKEPLISHAVPDRPWAKVGTDLFQHNGSEYLMCVDYYSKFPEIAKLNDTTSRGVILAMKSLFARHGIPDVVISDNGPQYASREFKCFADNWEFEHKTSSPRYAQSNGQAERMIQTIKRMLTKSQDENGDPYVALLEYRNTPLDGIGLSPAQLLMGRRLKAKLPTSSKLLTPKGCEKVQEKLKQRQSKQKFYYDKNTKLLPEISPGDKVRVQQGQIWNPATVLKKHDSPRSYVLCTPDGRIYRRNRKHLLKTKEQKFPSAPDQDDFNTEQETNAKSEREMNPDLPVMVKQAHQNGSTEEQTKPNIITKSGREIKIPSRFRDYHMH
ncbi:uncharacterized protein K02A2.6-like [Rhinichthys klamathensis goyatoka]|uniref:uncharacterized protein K02A2.6-like n=1 Tax=Rhinichthys klamathensis goyatoka TaxID=3034132 RepID=UPI0024B511A8|nr:uncharacterized protein K02A2.6-like [Rhinichthys klamathensis goyatoka]